MTINFLSKKFNQRRSLRSRIIIGLIAFQLLLTLGILANDVVINERAEEVVWRASLNSEMDYQIARRAADPEYDWPNTHSVMMFALDPANKSHAPLLALGAGLHDEFIYNNTMWVILIRVVDAQPVALLLQIDHLEKNEKVGRNTIFLAAGVVSLLLCIFIAWAAGWLVRPLRDVAEQIQQLAPDKKHQHIHLPKNASIELEIIADAMNTYIKRNERFIERERDFINMASHELRTPLSVIDGITKISLADTQLPEGARDRLSRIQDAINNVNEMITLLLVLAKDPARVQENSELIFLDKVIREIVSEHRFLADERRAAITVGELPGVEIFAPLPMVKCALGNLLRNAIEHSHGSDIFIELDRDSTITITNKNARLTMKEISEMYGRLARKSSRNGGGLGLDLISRLCAHCDWTLTFVPEADTVRFSVKFTPQR